VLNQQRLAKEQWRHTLNQVSTADRERLGDIAIEQSWFDLAIDAANSGAIWDRLDLRFPTVHWDEFQRIGTLQQLDANELIAIARRESGLYPLARSKVGARGLMQLMPSTARSMAAKQNHLYRGHASLYQPDTNILLGATYYRELMQRYERNRVKSLAAYNAGPSRVARWSSGALPFDQWVDSLPFGETREYVQAVLTYTVIYRIKNGVTASLLSQSERAAQY
jgi:soluble lytic murein transglycosylase